MPENYTPPGSTVDYVVPSGSDTADGPQAFKDFADSMPATNNSITVNTSTTSVTLAAGDSGTIIAMEPSSGDLNVTIPAGLPAGTNVVVAHTGPSATAVVKLVPSGTTVHDTTLLRINQYRMFTLLHLGGDVWVVGSGGVAATS